MMVTLQNEKTQTIVCSDEKLLFILGNYDKISHFSEFEKAVDECVKDWGAEFTAKLIVYAYDNNFNRTLCLEASVLLVKYLKEAEFAKFFFSKRTNGKGGIIKEVMDITEIINFYLKYEAQRREQVTIKDISYPNCMRKGVRSALENFKFCDFENYVESGVKKQITLKDIIKYFHPNPQKSVATIKMSVDDYINHFNNPTKYAKEIEKANSEAVDGLYEIDVFHAILYNFFDFNNEIVYFTKKKNDILCMDIEDLRSKIDNVNLRPDIF